MVAGASLVRTDQQTKRGSAGRCDHLILSIPDLAPAVWLRSLWSFRTTVDDAGEVAVDCRSLVLPPPRFDLHSLIHYPLLHTKLRLRLN
jgi:hypothetical protein